MPDQDPSNQPISNTPVQQEPVHITQKKKNPVILIIIIVFIVIALLGLTAYIAYMVGKNKGKETQSNDTSQSQENQSEDADNSSSDTSSTTTTTITADTEPDPYDGWKTYRNDEWGIEFKHNGDGSDMLTHENPGTSDPRVSTVGYAVNPNQESDSGIVQILWSVWENPEELSLNDFYDTYLDYDTSCTVDKNFTIGSNVVIKGICDERPQGVSSTDIYLIDSENRVFQVSYLHYMDETLMDIADLSIPTIKVY